MAQKDGPASFKLSCPTWTITFGQLTQLEETRLS